MCYTYVWFQLVAFVREYRWHKAFSDESNKPETYIYITRM